MLLYFSMLTLGFWAGAILSFRLFAAKRPEEEERITHPSTFVLINNKKQVEKAGGKIEETPLTPMTHPVQES